MRPITDLWQSDSATWQSLFIRDNLLFLGNLAWQGFLADGRGTVACIVKQVNTSSIGERRSMKLDEARFVPSVEMLEYLKLLQLEVNTIIRVLDAVKTYDPKREVLLTIRIGGIENIIILQDLGFFLPECSKQVK